MTTKGFISGLVLSVMLAGGAFAQDAPQELPARVTDYALTEAPDDHVLGSEDAAITMIVWASVTCPHCGDWFSDEWPEVKKELVDTGQLRFVFRQYPTQPAQLAMAGFMLAECAPREDYMTLIEYQMEQQDQIFNAARAGEGKAEYDKIAKMGGMESEDAIRACFNNPDMADHIQLSAMRAEAAGVRGVPALFINGEEYKGAQDAKSMIALIDDMNAKGISALPDTASSSSKPAGADMKLDR